MDFKNTNFYKIFMDRAQDMMQKKGIKQADLAEMTGIPTATISRYMTGVHSPKVEYVAKLAAAMQVSVDYLLGLSMQSVLETPPTPEERILVDAYRRADDHTKKMVMMQLELCMTDSEKEQAFQQQAKQAEKQPTETADSEDSSKDGETA